MICFIKGVSRDRYVSSVPSSFSPSTSLPPFLAPFLSPRLLARLSSTGSSDTDANTCSKRLIGFEEIGNDDSFTTTALELRLAQSGVIDAPQTSSSGLRSMYGDGGSGGVRGKSGGDEDDSIDWD